MTYPTNEPGPNPTTPAPAEPEPEKPVAPDDDTYSASAVNPRAVSCSAISATHRA